MNDREDAATMLALLIDVKDLVRRHPLLLLAPLVVVSLAVRLLGALLPGRAPVPGAGVAPPPVEVGLLVAELLATVVVLVVGTLLFTYGWLFTTHAALAAGRGRAAEEPVGVSREVNRHYLGGLWVLLLLGLAVGAGFALLILPGLFVAAVLLPAPAVFLEEGHRGVRALAASWHLTKGHRVTLLLVVVAYAAALVVAAFFRLVPLLGEAVSALLAGGVHALLATAAAVFYVRRTGTRDGPLPHREP